MGLFDLINDIFGTYNVAVHVSRDSGESFKAQRQLKEAGIKFKKEVEGMASTHLQVSTGQVSPIIKLKVNSKEADRAREILKNNDLLM